MSGPSTRLFMPCQVYADIDCEFMGIIKNRIIAICLSFLPDFSGENPYQQAYENDVTFIGATGQYVKEDFYKEPIY